ncbi:hypothetical protein [Sporosarcina koreensis]|uniref:hypothetical protein n=1 Tax=Sporosarcina koreensis TaxID=334735 RepID=UPI000753C113|nr:hypothetical protein [Sporosarcina koreensis]
MRLTVKEIDITPSTPISLAGFAHRDTYTETVYAPILLKMFYFTDDKNQFLLFVADLIWWDDQFVEDMSVKISKDIGIDANNICFHATHNHSGPQTSNKFSKELGILDEGYIKYLYNTILRNTHELLMKIGELVTVKVYKGYSDIGIYRRKKHEGQILMKPNEDIPNDSELTFIAFIGMDESMKGGLIHFACHPTSTDINEISSEFIGACCRKVSNRFNGVPVAFLQGFTGDIRPNLVANGDFFRGTALHMEELGERLAEDVIRIMANPSQRFTNFTLTSSMDSLPLYFDESHDGHPASEMLDEWRSLKLQKFMLNDQLVFLFCNAEMVQSYGLFAKQYGQFVLPVGYSNGMIGYVANDCQLRNGGYEAEQFINYFNLKGKLRAGSEVLIKIQLKKIMEEVHNESDI